MSGPRVWVDENDLRLVLEMARSAGDDITPAMRIAAIRLRELLDPPAPPPLRPYIACTQGHGA